MDYIYKSCITRIKANEPLFTFCGIKPIAHFDRFKGQYLNPELHQPWPKPALFFKFSVTWEDSGTNTQTGRGTLELHLELENYGESYDGSPDQDTALEDYAYQTVLYVILQNFKTAEFSPLKRRSTTEDDNPSNTNVTVITFDFEVIDLSAERYKDYLREPLDDMETIKEPLGEQAVHDDGNDAFVI